MQLNSCRRLHPVLTTYNLVYTNTVCVVAVQVKRFFLMANICCCKLFFWENVSSLHLFSDGNNITQVETVDSFVEFLTSHNIKGSSKCGFFHLAVLFRFYRVLFLLHVFLSEQIKMMIWSYGEYSYPCLQPTPGQPGYKVCSWPWPWRPGSLVLVLLWQSVVIWKHC